MGRGEGLLGLEMEAGVGGKIYNFKEKCQDNFLFQKKFSFLWVGERNWLNVHNLDEKPHIFSSSA